MHEEANGDAQVVQQTAGGLEDGFTSQGNHRMTRRRAEQQAAIIPGDDRSRRVWLCTNYGWAAGETKQGRCMHL